MFNSIYLQIKFHVVLSTRSSDLNQGDSLFHRVKRDDYWNSQQYERDLEMQARKKHWRPIGRDGLSNIPTSITSTLHKPKAFWRSNNVGM